MGYQTPNVSGNGGYGGGGGLMGILGALGQGFEGFQEGRQQKVENKQKAAAAADTHALNQADITKDTIEGKVAQAGLDKANLDATQANAQTLVTNTNRQLLTHPDMLKDPALRKAYLDASSTLHMPVAMDKDGNIDVDSTKSKQFGDLSVDEQAKYMEMDPSVRKYVMRDIGGVPSDFLSHKAVLTAKDESERLRSIAAGTNATTRKSAEGHKEYIDDAKLPYWERLADAHTAYSREQTTEGRAKIAAVINRINAQTKELTARAAAIPARLALDEKSLGVRTAQLGVSMDRLRFDITKEGLSTLHSTVTSLDEYSTRMRSELNGAQKEYDAYIQTEQGKLDLVAGTGLATTLQQRIHTNNDLLYTAEQQSKKARSMLANNQPQGIAISHQSGKQSTILPRKNQGSGGGTPVGTVPEGTKDGTTTQYQGKTLTARGGQWFAQ